MTHKVSPIAHRLGILIGWKSRWFNVRGYRKNFTEDIKIREFLQGLLRNMGIADIEIERSRNKLTVILSTSRPGLLIGRGGAGVEEIRKKILALLRVSYARGESAPKVMPELRLEVKEIRTPEIYAELVGQQIAEQLERRVPFRRVIKQSLERVMSQKGVEGARIMIKGRLDGSEMARKEWVKNGRLPLQSFRADINYAHVNAYTIYGVIGIRVWIYRGEKLPAVAVTEAQKEPARAGKK